MVVRWLVVDAEFSEGRESGAGRGWNEAAGVCWWEGAELGMNGVYAGGG